MKFQSTSQTLLTAKVDGVILPMMKASGEMPAYLLEIDKALEGELKQRLTELDFQAESGQVVSFYTMGKISPKAIYIVGMGKQDDLNAATVRKAYAAATRKAQSEQVKRLAILYLENDGMEAFFQYGVEGMLLGSYSFDSYRAVPEKGRKTTISDVIVHYLDDKAVTALETQLRLAQAIATGTNLARDLVNRPATDKTPDYLAKLCQERFSKAPYSIEVWDEVKIKQQKMGAFYSVANGSPYPPRFIHMHYQPQGKAKKRIVLIGKGVTFDTGGLSLKPPRYMTDMKDDMAGAAAVIGCFTALAALNLPIAVDGIIAATENIIGGSSTRPGDVVYAMNGKSIEVLNTDAEGRLTLADALCYACKLDGVDEVIDLATLTGACIIAVGDLMAAAMTNDDAMYQRFNRASQQAGEAFWQLPLPTEYKDYIKGEIADIKNMGPEGGAAGTILGGLFLQEFVTCKSWVHLDIAGPAFSSRDQGIAPKGGSGFGVRSLVYYLLSLA